MPAPAAPTNERIDGLVDAAMLRILDVTSEMRFATFQTACRAPRDLADADESTRETFRVEARLALLRRLEEAWPERRVKGVGHDVKLTLLPDSPKRVAVFVEPLFVAGRYRKLVRGLSQTHFRCRGCKGRYADRAGCAECGGTGRLVAEAVEDFLKGPIAGAVAGRHPSFHGAGREDVDVRMLGDGRPFVVSVQWARTRTIDGDSVARAVAALSGGRVAVSDLHVVDRPAMRRITMEHGDKTYRALVRPAGDGRFPGDLAQRLASLVGTEIRQRTPERVERRRADLVRVRRVLAIEVEDAQPDAIVARVRTEPGTYVKELVSGDGGRTEPSFSSALGQSAVCSELDVLSTDAGSDGPAGLSARG